ncbi:pectinesterase family protein [Pedobacter aquatilis]|uniref:pectinesterase family protein n=1 Tax=Pedobacter aquatilis TaxID=351343 RepID=UPI0025B4E247|nr:pectinesterase family protein [Pedobacter aquatilis]MDN3587775.1 pectinesterase family protein [Pedobacter aquatilis]
MKLISIKFLVLFFLLITGSNLLAQKTYPSKITVDMSGNGNYKTIQEAVNSIRDLGEQVVEIFVKNGTYNEKLVIPSWKTKILLIGESKENTIISNNDYSGKEVASGKDEFGNSKFSTFTSYTVQVLANDVTFQNLTIVNTAGRVGQAVALHVEGDRFSAINCSFLGNQDTLYLATDNSRQYYSNCYIEGTTDFIFGSATVVFESCTIKNLTNSFITAASTLKTQPFGFVFLHCKLIAEPNVNKAYLGRPWRPHAKTVFLFCDLGKHIAVDGWNPWKGDAMFPDKEKTTFYAEYENVGEGSATVQRVSWSKQLSKKDAKNYTVQNILKGNDGWNPTK